LSRPAGGERVATDIAAPPGLAARQAAHELVGAVLRRRQPLDGAFDSSVRVAALEPRDRALARLVAATTLRRLGQLDAVLARALERPLPPRAAPALDALRIGAAQLLFLGSPAASSTRCCGAWRARARRRSPGPRRSTTFRPGCARAGWPRMARRRPRRSPRP
jgi:hypothetical protein